MLALPVSLRTDSIVLLGKVFVTTPKLMKSVILVPVGSSATVRAICGPPVEFSTVYHINYIK
jgi:hypothetical protein